MMEDEKNTISLEEKALMYDRRVQIETLEKLRAAHFHQRKKINSQCNSLVPLSLIDEMLCRLNEGLDMSIDWRKKQRTKH